MLASPTPSQFELLKPPDLRAEAADQLFGDLRLRPSPLTMASLIEQGLTEATIVAAARKKGMSRPLMSVPLHDLEVTLPYLQQVSDTLADQHPDDTMLFAGRDAEVLFDDYSITHPDKVSYLLPASTDLWSSTGMDDRGLATQFLGQHGLTKQAIVGKDTRYTLVDSGFMGSIGKKLDETVKKLYDLSMLQNDTLSVRLVSATDTALGTRIIDLPENTKLKIIRYGQIFDKPPCPFWDLSNTHSLAVSMQLMPRYHGSYSDLRRVGDKVIALSWAYDNVTPDNLDKIDWLWVNSSIVNPVAAAITQYKVVRAAMERIGRIGPEQTSNQAGILGRLATALSVITRRF